MELNTFIKTYNNIKIMNLHEYIKKTAKKFINESKNNENYSSLIKDLMNELESRYNVDLFLYYNKFSNTIILSKISIDKENRSKGIGTKVMDEICDFADNNNLRIALTPSSDFGGSKTRLLDFYKRFGFKKYKGFEFKETMVRLPE